MTDRDLPGRQQDEDETPPAVPTWSRRRLLQATSAATAPGSSPSQLLLSRTRSPPLLVSHPSPQNRVSAKSLRLLFDGQEVRHFVLERCKSLFCCIEFRTARNSCW
jgi:hypothetical protein